MALWCLFTADTNQSTFLYFLFPFYGLVLVSDQFIALHVKLINYEFLKIPRLT